MPVLQLASLQYIKIIEHICGVSSAKEILDCIYIVFNYHTLLSRLRARRDLYIVQMGAEEWMLLFINMVLPSGSVLGSMSVVIDTQELGKATLSGLPSQFEKFITTLEGLLTTVRKMFQNY